MHEICRVISDSLRISYLSVLYARVQSRSSVSLRTYMYVEGMRGQGRWIHDHGCQCSGLLADCRYPRFRINVYIFNSTMSFLNRVDYMVSILRLCSREIGYEIGITYGRYLIEHTLHPDFKKGKNKRERFSFVLSLDS